MSTKLKVNYPITDCLVKAKNYLESIHNEENFQVNSITDQQQYFLENENHPEDLQFFCNEIKSKTSIDVSEINSWLKQCGYDIQLAKRGADFAVASIFEIFAPWKYHGKEEIISGTSIKYKAFSIKEHSNSIYSFDVDFNTIKVRDYDNPLILTVMKNGDILKLLEEDPKKENYDPLTMYRYVSDIIDKENRVIPINEIILPELDINTQLDINWLCEMSFDGSKGNWYKITEALQQIKFKLNKTGAEVKSAVATSCISGSLVPFKAKNTWIFDKPFYIWLSRPGTKEPYFSGYIDFDSFQELRNT